MSVERKASIKRKRTRTQIDKAACLKLWPLLIRARGAYERCGTTANLQAHHIIKKSQSAYLSVDVENGLCLCGKCHIGWWHYDEVRARGWLDAYKGAAFYEALSARRHLRRTNWAEVRAELQALVDRLEA